MNRTVITAWVVLVAALDLPGCYKVDVKLPRGVGDPPPTGAIAQADPANKTDLLRENRQLRQRIAWLDEENRDAAKEYAELENEQLEIQADIKRFAAERDRYRRALGR